MDPGLATGLAILHYSPEQGLSLVQSVEGDLRVVGEFCRAFLTTYTPDKAEVVAERFTITVATAKNSQAPWSLKVLGALDWLVWDHWSKDPDEYVHLQTAVEAKRLVTNDVLHKTGLWHRGGAGHANDAIRHGIRRFATVGVYDPFTS
jgi:hypothetical protein